MALPEVTTTGILPEAGEKPNGVLPVADGKTNGIVPEADCNRNGVVPQADGTLNVIVIGGGLGGLAAAIALRRQGHHVDVYEQSLLGNEIGAAIHMTPNATGILRQIGVDPADAGAVDLVQSRFLSANNDILRVMPNDKAFRWQNPWLQAHRAHLHDQLKAKAVAENDPGRPVRLMLNSRVSSVDADSATITLDNGSSYSADVLVGADGVHSKSRAALGELATQPFKGKHNAYRFIIPRAAALEDPVTAPLVATDGSMDLWYSEDKKIVLYPTALNTLLNFVCIHPAALSESSNDYQKAASKDRMLEVFGEFHPSVVALLRKAEPAGVKVYPLYDMKTMPTFVKGRLALVGDAAHPFTPHLGQGGAMALEDGISLGTLFDNTITPSEVPQRLQLYNRARYKRASNIQEFSRIVGGDAANSSTNQGQNLKVHDYIEYGFSHDEIHASTQLLREYKCEQMGQRPRTVQPTAFGPLPSPLSQTEVRFSSEPISDPLVTRTSIKFRTSATLVRNLFPNDRYEFGKKDTVATATLLLESFENTPWLRGVAYDSLSLRIHDVVYRGSGGQEIKTTYVPVVFENLTDTIVTAREELGMPKMFSDIEVVRTDTALVAKMSWRGSHWAELELKALSDSNHVPVPAKDTAEGVLVHKYIPSSGHGKPDADYDVLILDGSPSASTVIAKSTAPNSDVRFAFKDLGSRLLPTLHPVVSRLAEIPVFEIIEASVTKFQGVSGHPQVLRLS